MTAISDYLPHELMVCRIAQEVDDTGVTVLGSFTPLAYASYMLAKLTNARDAFIVAYNGLGVRPIELSITGSEAALYRGAVMSWSFTEIVNTVHLAHRGLVECVSAAQFDSTGAFNLSAIGRYEAPTVRLPGGAGAPEVVQSYKKVVAYVGSHDCRTLVDRVSFRTGGRGPFSPTARRAAGRQLGPFIIVTPLAVLRRDDDAPFTIESVHPGVNIQDVITKTGFPLAMPSNVPTTTEPSAQQLRLLREQIDPQGTARFDLLSGAERRELVRRILASEWERGEALVRRMGTLTQVEKAAHGDGRNH